MTPSSSSGSHQQDGPNECGRVSPIGTTSGGEANASHPSLTQIIDRIEVLRHKLEDGGNYVGANTASLALDEIDRFRIKIEKAKNALDTIIWTVKETPASTLQFAKLEARAAIEAIK